VRTIELTATQARNFKTEERRLKALARSRAYREQETVALVRQGRTLYVAHPNGKGSCGGCGTCRSCVASQGRAEERAVD
jgi:hypothetical protein